MAHRRFESWTTERKYAEAVRLVVEEAWPKARAAAHLGISRQRLIAAVKKHNGEVEEREARSEAARLENMGEVRRAEARPLFVQGEAKRIQPVGEFVRTYFDGLKCPRHNVHHDVPAYQDEIMAKIVDPDIKRLLIHVPPGHSKSTCGTVFTTIYEVCRNPNAQIGIMSGTTRMAERFLRQIKQFLTDPIHYKDASRNLIDDWGPFTTGGNLGTQNEFWTYGRQSAEKEPTVSAYGLGQQIQGTRFDRFICDDIALLDNQKNPDRIQDMVLLITQDMQTRLDETGELVIIGTRVLPGDVYNYLKELPSYEIIRYPCILDEYDEKVLWPEHFNFEAAVRQRGSMSAEAWELVYQNSELAGLGASFTPEQLERCHDMERHMGVVPPGCVLVAGLDPAGANAQAGFTAMVLMGVDLTTGMYHLIDLVNHKQMKAPQVLDQIKDWVNKYPSLRELRVETNGLQAQLYQYNTELQVALGNKGVRLQPHITHGRNKWDPQFGVEAMAPLVHNQAITIPWASANERRQFTTLTDQLIRFPAGKPDDLVMAMWFAWLGCREIWQRQAAPAFDPRKPLPARIRQRRRVVDFSNGVRRPTDEEAGGGQMFNNFSQSREFMMQNVSGIAVR